MQCAIWVSRIKQTSDEHIAGALVRDTVTRRNREEKSSMGFGEAIGVAKSVDYAAEIKRVGKVAAEAEAVKKTECFVDVAVFGAEGVNPFGPVRPVGYAHLFVFNWVIDYVYWI